MLPFLKKDKEAGGQGPIESEVLKTGEGDEEYDGLESAMSELSDALRSGDHKAAATAFRSAFQLCDAEPHEEGPHTEEET